MMWTEVIGIVLLFGVVIVDSSPVVCEMERADSCLSPFQDHLEKGVAEFVSLNDRDVADACLSYDVASKCVSYLLYSCSNIKAKYKAELDKFEYACSHLTAKDEFWPFMGNFSAIAKRNTSELSEQDIMANGMMLKAGAACTITLLLISCCVLAEVYHIWRQRRHVEEAIDKVKAKDEEKRKNQEGTSPGRRSDTKAPLIEVKS